MFVGVRFEPPELWLIFLLEVGVAMDLISNEAGV